MIKDTKEIKHLSEFELMELLFDFYYINTDLL